MNFFNGRRVAASAGSYAGGMTRAAAQQRLTQDDLLAFDATGNVTLLHVTDLHAQLKPVYFRPPSENIGVGAFEGIPPHLTGKAFLDHFGITPGSPLAYAHTMVDYVNLARSYGKLGGLDRMATLVKAIRADRGDDGVLLLDGGDTWQGSYTSLKTGAQDMVDCMALLRPDAMVGHWEFTYGEDRVLELIEAMDYPFLASNIFDVEWDEPVFDHTAFFRQGRASHRGDRPGHALYTDRQSPLDDSQLVFRYPAGNHPGQCRRGARRRRRGRGAAVAQRVRRRSETGDRGRRDRCHPDRPHP